MNSEMSASRHSVTNIIIRQPTNCAAALIIVGRLFVRPCCKVETSFVIRLSISPCECELKYFCGTQFIFLERSLLILYDIFSVTVAIIYCCINVNSELEIYIAPRNIPTLATALRSMPVISPSAIRSVISPTLSGPMIVSTAPNAARTNATATIPTLPFIYSIIFFIADVISPLLAFSYFLIVQSPFLCKLCRT